MSQCVLWRWIVSQWIVGKLDFDAFPGKTLTANAGGRGFESHRGQICFSQFTPFYEVECEKLFCKINFKIKILTK